MELKIASTNEEGGGRTIAFFGKPRFKKQKNPLIYLDFCIIKYTKLLSRVHFIKTIEDPRNLSYPQKRRMFSYALKIVKAYCEELGYELIESKKYFRADSSTVIETKNGVAVSHGFGEWFIFKCKKK